MTIPRITLIVLLSLFVISIGCSSDSDSDDKDAANNTNSNNDLGGDTTEDDGGTEEDQATPPPPSDYAKPCTGNEECKEPLFCGGVSPTKTICTKECTSQSKPCSGSPAGTVAYCIVKDQVSGKFSCAFICKHPQLGVQKCPDGLTCPDTPAPGTTLHICEPK